MGKLLETEMVIIEEMKQYFASFLSLSNVYFSFTFSFFMCFEHFIMSNE